MSEAVARILAQVEQLPLSERVDLADHLAAQISAAASPEIEELQLTEVRRRIEETDCGEVQTVPADAAFAAIRKLIDSAQRRS